MKSKIKNFEVKPSYYLCAPLALVAFFLMDFIGGTNFPGYDWFSNTVYDLTALNSYSFVISYIFCLIYVLLSLFSAFCLYKYFKKSKFNNKIKLAIKIFVIGIVISVLSSAIFLVPESKYLQEVSDCPVIGTTTVTAEDEEGNITESHEVFSFENTKQNVKAIVDKILNPMIIGKMLSLTVCCLLFIIALTIMIFGGFGNKGNIFFGGAAIFCLLMILFGLTSISIFDTSTFGIYSRFYDYAGLLFFALIGSWAYVTSFVE